MNHKPIQFEDLSLIYPYKTYFEAFPNLSGDPIHRFPIPHSEVLENERN